MANDDLAQAAASAIKALSILHNNPDDLSARSAIRAASEGRSAFWSTARYHDQHARNFLDEANDLPLADALRLLGDETFAILDFFETSAKIRGWKLK